MDDDDPILESVLQTREIVLQSRRLIDQSRDLIAVTPARPLRAAVAVRGAGGPRTAVAAHVQA